MLKEHPDWDVQKRAQELKPHMEAEIRAYIGEQGKKKSKETTKLSKEHGVEAEPEMPAARVNSILKKPENQDKAVMAYQANRKMGSIASTIGLPRNKGARGALRKFLRKKGLYKENGGWVKAGDVVAGFADKLLDKIGALEKHLKSTPISDRKALGGGVNLTQIVIFSDKSKGVWKPHRGERPGMRNNVKHGFQTEREAGAWSLAKVIGLDDLVTPCVEREFQGERGVVLEFQQGKVAHREMRERRYDGDEDLKRMAVFDAVIANTDRHEGNWMVGTDGKLRLIDHGLAFPESGDYSRNSALLEVRSRLENRGRDDSPAAYFKPYLDKKKEIKSTLTKQGLLPKAVDGVLRRIDSFSKAGSWRDLSHMIARR